MSLKHQIVLVLGVLAGSLCLISWLKVDSQSSQPLSMLQRPELKPSSLQQDDIPKPLGHHSMGEAKELVVSTIPAIEPARLEEHSESQSALLMSGLQSEEGSVTSLLELDESEFLPPPPSFENETLEDPSSPTLNTPELMLEDLNDVSVIETNEADLSRVAELVEVPELV